MEARQKNTKEYNDTASLYNDWQSSNVQMQQLCYYSCFNKLDQIGIKDKTFLEVGCGPCPIGKKLALKGAKKIYGLDISSEMLG